MQELMHLIEGPVALNWRILEQPSWTTPHNIKSNILHCYNNLLTPNQIVTLTHTGIISSTNVPNVETEWMIILVTNLKSSSSGGRVCFVQCGHLYFIFSTVSSLCINQSMALNDWYDVKLPGIVCMLGTSSSLQLSPICCKRGPMRCKWNYCETPTVQRFELQPP